MLALGPMPPSVRDAVCRLIVEQGSAEYGLMLTGGPTGCSYLDADGGVWNVCVWGEQTVEAVADGPTKVALVAIGAKRMPRLAAWLPSRPAEATDCRPCRATGELPPPLPPVQCPECHGLGWTP